MSDDRLTITRLKLENFTAFSSLDMEFSPGINVFIGPNATGKTHILKIIYAVMSALEKPGEYISKEEAILQKIANVFLPYQKRLGRLVKRARGGPINAEIKIYRGKFQASIRLQSGWGQLRLPRAIKIPPKWSNGLGDKDSGASVYLPPKEVLSIAPGFQSLYKNREIHFEEVYNDLLDWAYRPLRRGPLSHQEEDLLKFVKAIMGGRMVSTRGEYFFFVGSYGEKLEFTLLAEGIRKLALIWLLVRNGTLLKGSTLFWDEPEANLNPSMLKHVAEILLRLQRMGVQIFIATHSYVLVKFLDLLKKKSDSVRYFSLYREGRDVKFNQSDDYATLEPDAVGDALLDIYNMEVETKLKNLSGKGK